MGEPKRATKIVPRTKTLECVWCKHRLTVPALSARGIICPNCKRSRGAMEPVKK